MADNVSITAGSGTPIRAKDRSSVWTQAMLLDVSDGADAEQLGIGKSLPVSATSAGLTTASTAYLSGDQLGTELSFTSAVRANRGTVLQSVTLVDAAKVLGATDLLFFDQATTPAADNAASSWSDADMAHCLGIVHLFDVIQSANNFAVLGINLPVVLKPASGTTIFGDLVTRTNNSFFGAVTDVKVILGLSQD